jgi:hypothetical protein
MSTNGDKLRTLEGFISTAEYLIGNYLKDNSNCKSKELMPYVINQLSTRESEIKHKPQPIHTLAFIIAIKEMEKEGVIKIERGTVPFPMTDNESRFSLAKT